MNDSQSKITSFFKRPLTAVSKVIAEQSTTKVESPTKISQNTDKSQDGYGSDSTEIYDYETELAGHISKLRTNSQRKKYKPRKKNFTLPPEKEERKSNKVPRNSLTSKASVPISRTQLPETRRSSRLSSQVNTILSSPEVRLKENDDPNPITKLDSTMQSPLLPPKATTHKKSELVFAVKNRSSRKLVLEPEVITIEESPKVNKDMKAKKQQEKQQVSQQYQEPKVVYGKLWSERYQSESVNDFIGDKEAFQGVKQWLSTWNDKFDKNNDDGNDIPDRKSLFIHGGNGVGKTSLVYTIAKECGYKVLEYNSSCQKLTPSVLQKELLESAQSHCIGANQAKNSSKIASFFKPKSAKLPEQENPIVAQDSQPTSSQTANAGISKSLILFDDIDAILYEDRSDLWRIIRQTIRDGRKPMVFTSLFDLTFLTTEEDIFLKLRLNCIGREDIRHKVNHILQAEVQLTNSVSNRALIWKFVDLNSGDVRRAINQAQFWGKRANICQTEVISKHEHVDLAEHSHLVDLLSMDDCLTATLRSVGRNIDEHICDYNVHNYHRIPAISFWYERQTNDNIGCSTLFNQLKDCLHETHPFDPNYDRYIYDLKHFS